MLRNILIQMAATAIIFFPMCYKPIAAQAMTPDEFVKLFGVLDRYLQDLNKTFPSNPPPAATPNPTPDIPQPTESESIPEFN